MIMDATCYLLLLVLDKASLVRFYAIDSTTRLLQFLKCFGPLLFGQSAFFIANDREGNIFAIFVHQALNDCLGTPISLAIS
jgi:hypothetical protein